MGSRNYAIAIIAASVSTVAGAATAQQASPSPPQPQTLAPATTDSSSSHADQTELEDVTVTGERPSLDGGLLSVQSALQAASTVRREAIVEGAPAGTFVQAMESIPGVMTTTNSFTGLNGGDFTLRGFKDDEVGVTLNGVPINDSGNYRFNASLYSDADNIDHITVQQGWPSVDMPMSSAAGGSVAWATIDPSLKKGLDLSQGFGENQYRRTFVRANTGNIGPVRAWASYSNGKENLWSGSGATSVTKAEAKALWTINDRNAVSVSVLHARQINNTFLPLTTAQAAIKYDQGYTDIWTLPENLGSTKTTACNPIVAYNACYYKLYVTPFENTLVSADFESSLGGGLSVSVIPYFEYKGGGVGSTARVFQETTDAALYRYGYVHGDLNGDGVITDGARVIGFSNSVAYTRRPGVIVKAVQDFGGVDTLTLGGWWERPHEKQDNFLTPVDAATGVPADMWTRHDIVRYPNGQPMQAFNEDTRTVSEKVFLTNRWTPDSRWTVATDIAYVHVKRWGYEHEYDFATSGPDYMQAFGADFSGSYSAWTPSGGVKFQLNDANQFYLGAARTFRPPVNSALAQNTAADYFNRIHGNTSGFSAVNKAETSTVVDVGWRFYTGRLSASVDAYTARFQNKTVQGYDAASDETVITELPRVGMRGVNAEMSINLSRAFTVYGAYAYTVARQQTDLDAGDEGFFLTKGKTLTNTPRNAGYLRLAYHEGSAWANISAKYQGAVFGDWSDQQEVGGYTRVDFSAGYDLPTMPNASIKLNVFNLTNSHAFAWASNSPFSNSAGPDTYSMLQPRTFMVTFGLALH